MVIDRTLTGTNGSRIARVAQLSPDTVIMTFFGWSSHEDGTLVHGRPPRTYRTEKLAEKAARAWVNA